MKAKLQRLLDDVAARRLVALERADLLSSMSDYNARVLEAENAAYTALRVGIEDILAGDVGGTCIEEGRVYIKVPLDGEPLERMRAAAGERRRKRR